MKKNFLKVFVAVAALALMTACSGGGLNGMISDYEKACKDGDMEKAMKIAMEMDEKYDESDLTEEQIERIQKASMLLYQNIDY